MAKESFKIGSFHDGLNTKHDSRDIKDEQLADIINGAVDDYGVIKLAGYLQNVSTTSPPSFTSYAEAVGLLRFGSDYNSSGGDARTNYILVWNDANGKFYWLPGTSTWATPSHLDLSGSNTTDFGAGNNIVPVFYLVDGALRVCDGSFGTNVNWWIGIIKRTLFPDSGNTVSLAGWNKERAELCKPNQLTDSNALVQSGEPADNSGVPTGGVLWRVRNLRDQTDQIYTFSDATSTYSNENVYELDEYYGSDNNDESWQTVYKGTDGYADPGLAASSNYHLFGVGMHNEDDDASVSWSWELKSAKHFNTSSVKTFNTGQSLYLAFRLPGDENKSIWLGTHYKPLTDNNFLSLQVDDAFITFKNTDGSEYLKYRIDHTLFTDIGTPTGTWHVLEFPYDEAYEKSVSGAMNPQSIRLDMNIGWQRKGAVETTETNSNSSWNEGIDFIHLSDLRVGESGLVGTTTTGKQKFLVSYSYDDKPNSESLLYQPQNNEVVFANSTSSYKIGIEAYCKNPTYKRISGSNLYIEDEGIPYRIAELSYVDGLRGAWESEYPSSGRFAVFDTSAYKSGLIKTDGLPLLESYEAMNGFSPKTPTTTARYKTAVVMNRQVYIGNIEQNNKKYGDRMIKSTVNNFDTFPTEGREIDVVTNDGDDIVKLEAYADRILQFKKNVMYLINATRGSEFLEDTFVGKGIVHESSVTKTDNGIVWANANGAYLYNGEKVIDIQDGAIADDDWSAHIGTASNAVPQVFYYPRKKYVVFLNGQPNTNHNDAYIFSMVSMSWTYVKDKFNTKQTNFIVDEDETVKTFTSVTSGETVTGQYQQFTHTPYANSDFRVLTKDFDFNNPAIRKKCFKFYITYKSDGTSNCKVYYGTNGQSLTTGSPGTEVSTTSNFAGTSTSCYDSNGLETTGNVWKQAELIPPSSINNVYSIQLHFLASGSVTSTFEINDITIVYREKPLK